MSLTNCRFYEEKYPDIDSFVMVNVSALCCCMVGRCADIQDRSNRYAVLFCPLDLDSLDLWEDDIDCRNGRLCKVTRI